MCALAPHHPFPPQLRHYCAAHGVAQPGRDSVSRGCRSRRELERQVIRMSGVRAHDAAALAKRARVDAVQYRHHTPVPHIAAQTWPNSLAPCNQSRIHPRCHVFEERGRMRVKRRPPPAPHPLFYPPLYPTMQSTSSHHRLSLTSGRLPPTVECVARFRLGLKV